MSHLDAQAPEYDEAHRLADTLFPRAAWDEAQRDLAAVDGFLADLADKVGGRLRGNVSGKHPHPSRGLARTLGHTDVEVRLSLEYPEAASSESSYELAVFRSPRRTWLSFLRRQHVQWEPVGRFSPTQVRQLAPELREAIGSAVGGQFADQRSG